MHTRHGGQTPSLSAVAVRCGWCPSTYNQEYKGSKFMPRVARESQWPAHGSIRCSCTTNNGGRTIGPASQTRPSQWHSAMPVPLASRDSRHRRRPAKRAVSCMLYSLPSRLQDARPHGRASPAPAQHPPPPHPRQSRGRLHGPAPNVGSTRVTDTPALASIVAHVVPWPAHAIPPARRLFLSFPSSYTRGRGRQQARVRTRPGRAFAARGRAGPRHKPTLSF